MPGDLDWQEFRDTVLNGVGGGPVIIFEPNVDWGIALFQRPHHMAIALGRLGCLVIFKTVGDRVAGFRAVAENVWLANDRSVNAIAGAVRCFYSTSPLADADQLRAAGAHGRVVYEYIDHIDGAISGGERALKRLQEMKHAAFGGAADVVVSSAAALHCEATTHAGDFRCAYVANGVDVRHYRDPQHRAVELPEAFLRFSEAHRCVVGYFGAIAPWLWYEAIEKLSALMPDVGFAFIGPDYSGGVPLLPKRTNVLYLGAVDYAVLPGYARLFDVCFIPFKPGDLARATSPLKLYEYFALEKPVVVTADMNECVVFPEVFSGRNADEFVEAIERAFAVRNSNAYCEKLRALADENDWSVRAVAYLAALEEIIRI